MQRASLVRALAEVGCSLPLELLNGLVGAIMRERVPGDGELAALVYGLARMGRKVRRALYTCLCAWPRACVCACIHLVCAPAPRDV